MDQEKTIRRNQANTESSNNINKDKNQSTPKEDKTSFWKPVVVGGVAAVAMGFGASVAYASINDDNFGDIPEGENSSNEESNNENVVIPDNVPIAESVNDDMSFSEAFAAAREEVGAGGVFEWNGNMYNTYTAEEWEDMTPEERSEFSDNFVDAMRENQSTEPSNGSTEPANATDEPTNASTETANISAEPTNISETPEENLNMGDTEIEVLSVNYGVDLGDGVYADAIATVDVDGETVYMIDVDGDGEFDAAANDFGQTDLPDTDMTVDEMQEDIMINELLAEEGSNEFDDMPDYMNDADISDFA